MNLLPALFCVIVAFGVPLGILILAIRLKDRYVLSFIIGALTFFVTQILLRLPILQLWLPKQDWFLILPTTNPWLYCLLLGFSASLFEELGRYLAFCLLLRGRTRWFDGIAFGAGHGGIEAILLIGLNYLISLIQYGGAPFASGGLIMLAGVERLSAMASHIGMTMLVLQSVRKKKPIYLFAALLVHGVMDTAIGIMPLYGISIAGIEIFLLTAGLLLLGYTFYTRKNMNIIKEETL